MSQGSGATTIRTKTLTQSSKIFSTDHWTRNQHPQAWPRVLRLMVIPPLSLLSAALLFHLQQLSWAWILALASSFSITKILLLPQTLIFIATITSQTFNPSTHLLRLWFRPLVLVRKEAKSPMKVQGIEDISVWSRTENLQLVPELGNRNVPLLFSPNLLLLMYIKGKKRNVVLPSKYFCSKKRYLGFDSHLQAYTNELELEVAHLQAENARLKRQQDQVNKQREVLIVLPFWSAHVNSSIPYSLRYPTDKKRAVYLFCILFLSNDILGGKILILQLCVYYVCVCAVENGCSNSATQKEHTSTVFHSSILRNPQVLISLLGIEIVSWRSKKMEKVCTLFY